MTRKCTWRYSAHWIIYKRKKDALCASPLTKEHNYLNFAETKRGETVRPTHLSRRSPACRMNQARKGRKKKQAVRSLGPLGYACYQASTCGLSTSSSRWDLDLLTGDGKTRLGCGFALRCLQRLSLLDVAIQRCSWQSNWHTSGRAISVLSYWR